VFHERVVKHSFFKGKIMKHLKFLAVLAAVSALSCGVAAVADAQTTDQAAPKLVVHYSAASLATENGVRRLYSRLVSAAEKVCGDSETHIPNASVLACRKQAVTDAVAQIHNTRLAELSTGSRIG